MKLIENKELSEKLGAKVGIYQVNDGIFVEDDNGVSQEVTNELLALVAIAVGAEQKFTLFGREMTIKIVDEYNEN